MTVRYYLDTDKDPEVGLVVNDYTLTKLIENTRNSVIFSCHNNQNHQDYAIKMVKYRKSAAKRVDDEIQVLKEIDSEFVITPYEMFDYLPYKCIIMPLAVSDAWKLFQNAPYKRLDEHTCKSIMKSILYALKYLHDRNIIHLDVKPDNFLIFDETGADVLLADFGFAQKIPKGKLGTEYNGTLLFASPEILTGTPYDKSVDIWSLGVSMYILLSGMFPFPISPESVLRECIIKGRYFFPASKWASISRDAKDLLSKMIVVHPSQRLTVDQCLEHKWLQTDGVERSSTWHSLPKIIPKTMNPTPNTNPQ